MIILLLTFVINLYILLCLTTWGCMCGWTTDITEIDNVFMMALAAPRPPKDVIVQEPDGTPVAPVYKRKWRIKKIAAADDEHLIEDRYVVAVKWPPPKDAAHASPHGR